MLTELHVLVFLGRIWTVLYSRDLVALGIQTRIRPCRILPIVLLFLTSLLWTNVRLTVWLVSSIGLYRTLLQRFR